MALERLNCLKLRKKNVILEPTYKLQDTLIRPETDITLSLQTRQRFFITEYLRTNNHPDGRAQKLEKGCGLNFNYLQTVEYRHIYTVGFWQSDRIQVIKRTTTTTTISIVEKE